MTIQQKQCLLHYLGYYTGNIDGIWGDRSAEAEAAFRQTHPDGEVEAALRRAVFSESVWDTVKYFTPGEFACKCGCGRDTQPDPALLRLADTVRTHFAAPVIVSSGVRCESHNKAVGGVEGSRHVSGKAMDFRVSGRTATQALSFVQTLPGVRYAYAIDRNYIHMDVK